MGKTGVIVGVIILLAVAGGAFLVTRDSDDSSSSTPTNSSASNSSESAANTEETEEQSSATVRYTDDGFSSKTVTVKAGSTVTVNNDSSSVLQFSSNPHPEHTDEEELNLSSLGPGKSTTFKVTRTGNFGFHNHLNSEHTGTLKVE